MKLHLVSLGCARNLVDSEIMLGNLSKANFSITEDPSDAEVIIINTCSFIQASMDESIDVILEHAELKKKGPCRFLIVVGCLPERFKKDIEETLPEVDLFLGTGAYHQIEPEIKRLINNTQLNKCACPDPSGIPLQNSSTERHISTPHMAYVKIAEGCSSHCTYCIIPKLRGKHRSRTIDDIRRETETLISSGTKEIVLIAQESTFYGNDFRPKKGLESLLDELSGISDDVWFRVLYGHPDSINDPTIETIKNCTNICSYFDLPVQHISSRILKRMGRKYDKDYLYELFHRIRSKVKGASLRTTLITGFPGETEEDFQELIHFIDEIQFDHLGVFMYSDSEDLPSHHLPGHVPVKISEERHDYLMNRQAQISLSNNQKHLNNTYKVLVEEHPDDGLYIGRTSFQAPEVDGVTFIYSPELTIGEFVNVQITEAYEYDIAGDPK